MQFSLSDAVALLSFCGMVATFIWTIKNIKRTNKQEIAEQATEKANVQNAIEKTSNCISEIKDDVKEIKVEVKGITKRQSDIEKNVAVLERDLKTAFKKIDGTK